MWIALDRVERGDLGRGVEPLLLLGALLVRYALATPHTPTTSQDLALPPMQAARAKPKAGEHPPPPLNVSRFLEWINGTLLKHMIDPPIGGRLVGPIGKRKPICEKTAQRWLHTLGFGYRSHKKMIFFDGHKRPDVVADRAEKLVMLEVLREVGCPTHPIGSHPPHRIPSTHHHCRFSSLSVARTARP